MLQDRLEHFSGGAGQTRSTKEPIIAPPFSKSLSSQSLCEEGERKSWKDLPTILSFPFPSIPFPSMSNFSNSL